MVTLHQKILILFSATSAYISWLRWTPSMTKRREVLRENIEGLEVASMGKPAQVKQIDVIKEENGLFYSIRKLIPHLRKLNGETVLTIQFGKFGSRQYLWAEDDIGEGFNRYLQEVTEEEYTDLNVVRPDLNSDSMDSISKITLRIESVDVEEIEETISMIGEFREYYYNTYPGDIRYQPIP